jgi:hypothetical protein
MPPFLQGFDGVVPPAAIVEQDLLATRRLMQAMQGFKFLWPALA